MNAKVGWHFPPTNGGIRHGHNDAGIAHYEGAPLTGLARETIQNSLDARASDEEPVHVTFERQEMDSGSAALGFEELKGILQECISATDSDDTKAIQKFKRASGILDGSTIPFLRIVDRATTGLKGKQWPALVKASGTSRKDQIGAGGSFGIGKSAPFSVSPLRTVFYWSRFEDDERGQVEQFQGKAVLASHGEGESETQGTGFYGVKQGCRHLTGSEIPEEIMAVENQEDRGNGTSLWIPGFDDSPGWSKRIAGSVIANFFCAIDEGKLNVLIEPEEDDNSDDSDLLEIDTGTLGEWFDRIENNPSVQKDDNALKEAKEFLSILTRGRDRNSESAPVLKEKEDKDFGHCQLWIDIGDHLSSKVALIRQTGMLITSSQKELGRFSGVRPFAAVCRFDSEEGNELLRRMENPTHDQFEPERLEPHEFDQGRRALRRIVQWIRKEIRAVATAPRSESATVLTELAKLLPDTDPDDAFSAGNEDRRFGGDFEIRLKSRRTVTSGLAPESAGDERDDEDSDGGADSTESDADSDGKGGESPPGRDAVAVEDVRYLPTAGNRRGCRISFTSRADIQQASFSLVEAGDSVEFVRSDLKVVVSDGSKTALTDYRLDLAAGKRYGLEIAAERPIDGRAWRLRVLGPKRSGSGEEMSKS